MVMPELELPGAALYYETAGQISSPAVLLIHSGLASLRMWDPLVPELASDHFVVRYDTRGYGRTVSTNAEYSNRSDAIDLLDHLGVERAAVVGSSRGGSIGIDLALEHPDRITGLVTIGSVEGDPSSPPVGDRLGTLDLAALIVVGEDDDVPALAHYDHLVATIPGAEGCRFADAGHLPSVEHPAEFEAVLLSWLADKQL